MADLYTLTGPSGSSMNIASFVLSDPGPDFGEADLQKAAYSENPAAEGGILAFETVNMRRMQFPVRVASLSAFGGANGLQSWLRTLARPGATLDIQLDGVATAEAIRFDVGAGRFEPGVWNMQMYSQLDRFDGTLKLDVQPFGYWPTMILLASSASVGGPGVLSLNLGGSIFGDAPGLAELWIAPTSATSYGDTQKTDSVYWSLGARPSFQAFWPAASGLAIGSIAGGVPTLLGDLYAPGSQAIRYNIASVAGGGLAIGNWRALAAWVVPPALEPAYRGRFRIYAWTRLGPSQGLPFYISADAQAGTVVSQPLGTAAPIATLPPSVASTALGPSPAYSFLSCGEVSLPIAGSNPYEAQIRLWTIPATAAPGLSATINLDIGGIYLQPLDGAAGVLTAGILQPTSAGPSALGRFYHTAVTHDSLVLSPTSVIGSVGALANAGGHRGLFPIVGASTLQLDLNLAGIRSATTGAPSQQPPIRSEAASAQVSVRYRPRFQFVKGI